MNLPLTKKAVIALRKAAQEGGSDDGCVVNSRAFGGGSSEAGGIEAESTKFYLFF
jgi:hypothetical protein